MVMRFAPLALLLVLTGCGGNPTSPSPLPTPTPSPSPSPTPDFSDRDLLGQPGFDLGFYQQFARGTLEGPPQPLRVLTVAPAIYLQTSGLTPQNVAALEQAARLTVPALTGDRFQMMAWETGAEARAPREAWIVVDVVNDDGQCGRAFIGQLAGHVWLNLAARCARGGLAVHPPVFAHELGHALGFDHVEAGDALMHAPLPAAVMSPSAQERQHGAIAYSKQRGT